MDRYGLDLYYIANAPSEEIVSWYQFHRHAQMYYSKVLDLPRMQYFDLMDLKDVFDIHAEFKVRFKFEIYYSIGLDSVAQYY